MTRWIVAGYPKDEPQKVWQIGVYKHKKDAKRRANNYVTTDDVVVVVFEAWMQKEDA
jgi:hypothetical protein